MSRRSDRIASARLDTATEVDWRSRARCRGYDPELWFPVGTGPAAQAKTAKAKSICGLCPVREQCLAAAQAAEKAEWSTYGIWGGLDESERRVLRKRLAERRPVCHTPRRPPRWP